MRKLTVVIGLVLALLGAQQLHAAESVPLTYSYRGTLLTSGGTAVTTAHVIRFSYWRSADAVPGDITGAGAINTGATNYQSWQEEHTVTPNARGIFAVELGSVNAFPNLNISSLFLQIEVKPQGQADTVYEILDPKPANSLIDRTSILAVPFARNADFLDFHDTGTSSGSIAVLGTGGLFSRSMIPLGTNLDNFTIDSDNTSTGSITLEFGETLGKTLTYDTVQSRFRFNDSLTIEGNLTVTGLVNGLNLGALNSGGAQLSVSTGAGLTVGVTAGSYRLNGTIYTFTGDSSVPLPNNATRFLYFTTTGLTTGTAFPTDASFIPLARVVTAGGAVTNITDKRVLQNDDRQHTIVEVLHPIYEGSTLQADGLGNIGQMSVENDEMYQRNYYQWTSTKATLQDYDILIRKTLPNSFIRWNDSLSLMYRTTSASSTNNKVEVQVYDTSGNPVTLSGSVTDLAGTSWRTAHIEFTGTPTWTPGEAFLIRLKMYAKDTFEVHAAKVTLDYDELE